MEAVRDTCLTFDDPAADAAVAIFVRSIWQERDVMVMQFQRLKAQLSKLRGSERERLRRLTMMVDAAEKELKAKCTKVTAYVIITFI